MENGVGGIAEGEAAGADVVVHVGAACVGRGVAAELVYGIDEDEDVGKEGLEC